MQTTMQLLEKALATAPVPFWTEKLKLTRNAISTAKHSGHLTPVIAGALAAEIGEDVAQWTTLAVIEGAKDSPAKRALVKKLHAMRHKVTSLYFALGLGFQRPRFSAR